MILDDIIEWSASVLDCGRDLQDVQTKLRNLQTKFILCNPAFSKQYIDSETAYVNVNTPQSNDTWKRVWDSKKVLQLPERIMIGCNGEECNPPTRTLIKVNPNIIIKDIF